MRRVFLSAGLFPVTFVLGVLVTLAWWQLFTRRVSLCMLARDPAAYNGKRIRVEALGSVLSSPSFPENDILILESGCSEPNAAWASVRLDQDFQEDRQVHEFVNSRTLEIRDAQVVVEGLFDQWATMGCFGPRFGINNASLIVVSPITSRPLRTHDSQ